MNEIERIVLLVRAHGAANTAFRHRPAHFLVRNPGKDINGDGVDEVVISHLCLDANGKEIWNNSKYFSKNNDHMDAMEFFDINGDGKPELLVGQSDVGTLAYNAQTGAMLWQNISDHSQQITAGYILGDSKTPQVVTNGRVYGPAGRPGCSRRHSPGLRPAAAQAGAPGAPGAAGARGRAEVEVSAAGRRRRRVRSVWAAEGWARSSTGSTIREAAGALAREPAERESELRARRLVWQWQADLFLVPLQAGTGWERDSVLQGRGLPHVRL